MEDQGVISTLFPGIWIPSFGRPFSYIFRSSFKISSEILPKLKYNSPLKSALVGGIAAPPSSDLME